MKVAEIPCYAFSARHASRHLSQFYEHQIASSGLHVQQFTTLIIVKHKAPVTVLGLAEALGMDRTTLARNLRPLERDGLISIISGEDRRHKVITLMPEGAARLEVALTLWRQAQAEFEARFGVERAAKLRDELRAAAEAVSC